MDCPRCGIEMSEVVKHGVVIDFCKSCGGMWLDKGELAKIATEMREAEASLDTELAAIKERRHYTQEPPRNYQERGDGDRHYSDHKHYDDDKHYDDYKHRKKTGFQKLFDIFD